MTFGASSSWGDEGSSMHPSELCHSLQQHHIRVKTEKPSANASVEKSFKKDPTPQGMRHLSHSKCLPPAFISLGFSLKRRSEK